MKLIYFERSQQGLVHRSEGNYVRAFYIPDENVILYKERHGLASGESFGLSTWEQALRDGREISQGNIPNVEGVKYSNIREIEYEDSKLRALLQDARLKAELETKVRTGIEDLLKQIE